MADIDELSIKIEASAEKAMPAFNKLIESLSSLNSALTRSGSTFNLFTASIGRATTAMKELNTSVKQLDVTGITGKLKALERIDLSNLQKTLNFDIKLDGSEVQKTEEAFRISAEKIKSAAKDAADSMIRDFHISSAEGQKAAREMFEAMSHSLESLPNSSQIDKAFNSVTFSRGEAESFKNGVTQMENEWGRFLNYFNTHKIKYIQDVQEIASAMEMVGRNGDLTRYFSKNGAVDVENEEEMVRLANEFSTILSSTEMKAANLGDRMNMLVEAIRKAKDESARSNSFHLNDDDLNFKVFDAFSARLDEFREKQTQIVQEAKNQVANNKIMLDIGINEEKFLSDIQKAINKATAINYEPVDIKLKVDTTKIKNSIADQFKGIDLGTITGLAEGLKQLNYASANMDAIGKVDFSKITAQIKKLSELDSSKLEALATGLNNVLMSLQLTVDENVIQRLSSLFTALSKIAKNNISDLVDALPNIGTAINSMLTSIASAPSISESNVSALTAISQMDFNAMSRNASQTSQSGTNTSSGATRRLSGLGSGSTAGITAAKSAIKALSASIKALGSAASSVYGSVKKLFDKIGGIAATGIKKAASAVAMLVDRMNPLKAKAHDANITLSGLVSTAMRLYTRFYMLRRVINLFTTAVSKSTNYIESYHYFDVAFSKIGKSAKDSFTKYGYESAEAYADSFSTRALELNEKMSGYKFDSNGYATSTGNKSLGLDSDQLLQYQAQYAQMADSIGMTGEAALATSKALTMLAGDWSSLRNISFSSSYEKMASALAGQARSVRSLGIDITQASLAETAANIGITTSITKMGQSEKAMLRMITMINQSKVAWGDLATTLNTPANQMRMLQQNAQALARTLGNLFLPAVANIIPYVNGLVIALQRLFQWIANFLGIDVSKMITSTGGLDDSLGDLVDDSDVGSLADDAGDTADALDDANESAKKLKKTILAFDELNVLNSPDSSTNTGKDDDKSKGLSNAELGKLNNALLDALKDYEEVWNKAFESMTSKAHEIAKALEEFGTAVWGFITNKDWVAFGDYLASYVNEGLEKLYEAVKWDKIKEKILPLIEGLAKTLNRMLDDVDFEKLGEFLGGGIDTVFSALYTWYSNFDFKKAGNALRDIVKGIIDEVNWTTVGGYLGAKFQSAWDLLKGFVENFPTEATGKALSNLFKSFIDEVDTNSIGETISTVFNNVIDTLESFLKNFDQDGKIAGKLSDGINSIITNTKWEKAGTTLGKFANRLFGVINNTIKNIKWKDLGDKVSKGFINFINAIEWSERSKEFSDGVNKIFEGINQAITNFRNDLTLGTKFGEAVNNIFITVDWNAIGNAIGGSIAVLVDQIYQFVSTPGLFTNAGIAFGNLLNGALSSVNLAEAGIALGTIFNGLFDSIKGFVETFKWEEATDKLELGINSFIATADGAKAGESLNALITEVLDSIKTANIDWEGLGQDVGDFIKNIHWLDHFNTAKDIIVEALGGFFSGILTSALGNFGTNFADGFVKGVKAVIDLDEALVKGISKALEALANVLNALPPSVVEALGTALGVFFTVKISLSLVNNLASFVTNLGLFKLALGGGSLATLTKGLGDAFAAISASKIGTLATQTGAFATACAGLAGVLVGLKVSEKSVGEEEGFEDTKKVAMSVTGALAQLSESSENASDKLSMVAGQIENIAQKGSWSESIEAAATAFEEAGITADELSAILGDKVDGNIDSVIVRMHDLETQSGTTKSSLDYSDLDSKTLGYDDVKGAIKAVGDEFGTSDIQVQRMTAQLKSQEGTITTASGWFEALKDKLKLTGEKAEEAHDIFNSKLIGSIKNVGSESETAKNKADPLTQILDSMAKEMSWSDSFKMAILTACIKTMGENSEDSEGKLSNLGTKLDAVGDKVKFQSMIESVSTVLQNAGVDAETFYDVLEQSIKDAGQAVPTGIENIKNSISNSKSDLQSTSKTTFEAIGTGAKEGIDGKLEDVKKSSKTLADTGVTKSLKDALDIHSPSGVTKGIGGDAGTGLAKGLDEKLQTVQSSAKKLGVAIPEHVKKGLDEKSPATLEAVKTFAGNIITGFEKKFSDKGGVGTWANENGAKIPKGIDSGINTHKQATLKNVGELANGIVNKFKDIKTDIANKFSGLETTIKNKIGSLTGVGSKVVNDIKTGIENNKSLISKQIDNSYPRGIKQLITDPLSDLYHDGYRIGSDFAKGIAEGVKSIKLSSHVVADLGNVTTLQYGNTTVTIQGYSIEWYAKGGLFTKPTLAGFGEAGDEAALPLTNKSVMSKIAKSITESGGYGGMNRDDMIEAVATGVAMAMSQNPQTAEIIVHSVLKTDDETLAQAVSRGQSRLDMRYNAVAAYGY